MNIPADEMTTSKDEINNAVMLMKKWKIQVRCFVRSAERIR